MPPPRCTANRGGATSRIAVAAVAVACLWASPGAYALDFAAPVKYGVGSSPQSVATGDFNADSDPDLAVVNQSSNSVSVLLGAAGGGFGAATSFAVGTTPLAVAVGDFNADSDPDLAVTNEATNDVSVLLGGAGGSFGSATSFLVGSTPQSVAAADFNADADPDLAVVNEGSGNVSILTGGAGGTFSAPTNFGAGGLPRAIVSGNFNGDADPDLAVANEATNNVSVLTGAAGATFTGPVNFGVCSGPTALASGQLNGDSDPDLAVANELCHNVSVLSGGSGSTFSAATNFPTGNLPDAVAVGEFNGDARPDLAVANQGSDNVSILTGGTAGFVGPTNFLAGDNPTAIVVADFNADLNPDLAVTNELSNDVAILLGTTNDGYPRTKGATPMRVSLVPALAQCLAPNRVHGPPALGGGSSDASCAPPVQTSTRLTVGTPESNGAAVNSVGYVRFGAIVGVPGPPDDSDIAIDVSMTDVRCSGTVATCGAANSAGGADYTGELTPDAAVRLTDHFNGIAAGGGTSTATVQDFTLTGMMQVPCSATASTAVGATCALSTTLDALSPGAVLDTRRATWQLGQVELLDGGADGEASTTPNTRLAVQGVFVP